MFTVRSAFSELRKDLDPLGSAATELRGAEAVAALKQQEATPAAITSLKVREQQQKAERNLLSTLLSYPLPVAASVVAAAQEANEEKEGLADAELSPPGHLSAGALSVP